MSGRARRKGEFPSERDASPGSGTSACRRRTRMEGHSNLCPRPPCRPPPDPAPRRAQALPWRSPWPGPSVGVRGRGPTRQVLLPGTCPVAWPPKRPSQAASKPGLISKTQGSVSPRVFLLSSAALKKLQRISLPPVLVPEIPEYACRLPFPTGATPQLGGGPADSPGATGKQKPPPPTLGQEGSAAVGGQRGCPSSRD